MMIAWNGFGSFTISTKTSQGDVTVVTNPFSREDGSKFPRSLAASIVVQSHEGKDTDNIEAITAEYPEDPRCPFVIPYAGEYEVRAVAVTGVYAPKKNGDAHTIYRIDAESMRIGFLGALDRALTDKEAEALGNIDILILPAGGGDVLGANAAAEVVALVEPRMVIPSYVTGEGVESPYAEHGALCRELSCPTEAAPKLKITRAQLPEEDMKIVTLSRA